MLNVRPISLFIALVALFQPSQSAAIELGNPQFNGLVQAVVTESSTWEKGATVYREVTQFDQRGRIIETETAFLKNVDEQVKILGSSIGKWIYDAKGRRAKTVFTGSTDMVLTYAYDEHGHQIDQTSYDKNGGIILQFIYSYDADGNQREVKGLKADGQVIKRFLHEYDDRHQRTQTIGFNADGSIEYRVMNRYGNEGESKISVIYDGRGSLTERVVYTYLKNSLVAQELRYSQDGNLSSKTNYSYEYDDKGNWTKQTSIQSIVKAGVASPEQPNITRRTIKYY